MRLFKDPMNCPVCGGPSHVYNSAPPRRYRRCQNELCRKIWRTQEVIQSEADELMGWFSDQANGDGEGLAALLERVGTLYENAQELARFLGWTGEEGGEGGSSQSDQHAGDFSG